MMGARLLWALVVVAIVASATATTDGVELQHSTGPELIIPRESVALTDMEMGESEDLSALTLSSACDRCAFATTQIKSTKDLHVAMHLDSDGKFSLVLEADGENGENSLSKKVCGGNEGCAKFIEKARSSPRYLSALFYGCSYTVWGDENNKLLSRVSHETVSAGQELITATMKAFLGATQKYLSASADVDTKRKECEREHAGMGHKLLSAVGLGPCSESSHELSEVVGKRDQALADLKQFRKYKRQETMNQFNRDFKGSDKYYMTTLRYNGVNACPTPLVCGSLGSSCDAFSGKMPQITVDDDRSKCADPGACFGGRVSAVPEQFFNEFAHVEMGRVKIETAVPAPNQKKAILPHATVGEVVELTEERAQKEKQVADIAAVKEPVRAAPHHSHNQNLRAVQFRDGHIVNGVAPSPAEETGPKVFQFRDGHEVGVPTKAGVKVDTKSKSQAQGIELEESHGDFPATPAAPANGEKVFQFNGGELVNQARLSEKKPSPSLNKKASTNLDEKVATATPDASHLKIVQFRNGHRVGAGHHHSPAAPKPAKKNTSVLNVGDMQCHNNGGECAPGLWCCYEENYWYGQGIQCTPVGVCVESCISPTDSRDNNGKCLFGAVSPDVASAAKSLKAAAIAVADKIGSAAKTVVKAAGGVAADAGAAVEAVGEGTTSADLSEKAKGLGVGEIGCNKGAGACTEGSWCCYEDGYYFGEAQIPCGTAGVCVETCDSNTDTRNNKARCLHGGAVSRLEAKAAAAARTAAAAKAAKAKKEQETATSVKDKAENSSVEADERDPRSEGLVLTASSDVGLNEMASNAQHEKTASHPKDATVHAEAHAAKEPSHKGGSADGDVDGLIDDKSSANEGDSDGKDQSDLQGLTAADMSEVPQKPAAKPKIVDADNDDDDLDGLLGQ